MRRWNLLARRWRRMRILLDESLPRELRAELPWPRCPHGAGYEVVRDQKRRVFVFLSRSGGSDDGDGDRRPVKRHVVVAAVPQDHFGFGGGARQHGGVIDARIDHRAVVDVGLVFLHFLDREPGADDVFGGLITLDAAVETAVGIGWRTTTARRPAFLSALNRWRVRVLLPAPVREATTATTGTGDSSMLSLGPSSAKEAPLASAIDARCMTCWWRTSL